MRDLLVVLCEERSRLAACRCFAFALDHCLLEWPAHRLRGEFCLLFQLLNVGSWCYRGHFFFVRRRQREKNSLFLLQTRICQIVAASLRSGSPKADMAALRLFARTLVEAIGGMLQLPLHGDPRRQPQSESGRKLKPQWGCYFCFWCTSAHITQDGAERTPTPLV